MTEEAKIHKVSIRFLTEKERKAQELEELKKKAALQLLRGEFVEYAVQLASQLVFLEHPELKDGYWDDESKQKKASEISRGYIDYAIGTPENPNSVATSSERLQKLARRLNELIPVSYDSDYDD